MSRSSFRCLFLLRLSLAAFATVFSTFAADPNAGLDSTPGWTQTSQLKAKWGNLPLTELRAQAEHGDAEAQHYLGWRYSQGEGVPTDPSTAVEWYRKAAEQGFALAQNNLGTAYLQGHGVAKDPKEAERWFTRAAEQRLPDALFHLGESAYQSGSAGTKRVEFKTFCELAAERGDLRAAYALGYWYMWEVTPAQKDDWELGAYWFSFAASHGYAEAYNQMGWIYMDGRGVPKDYDEARHWFEKGAEQNDPFCQLGMGLLELRVDPLHPDLQQAKRWMLKAAESTCPKAWLQLGRLSELRDIAHDPTVKPDYVEAARWYQQAADAGIKAAVQRLAELVDEGKITSTEDPIVRLRRLADMGNKKAQLDLAQRYLNGEAKPRHAQEEPLALFKALVRGNYAPAMVAMADLYRTGHSLKKDPVQALFLIHWALRLRDSEGAWERFEDLKEAVRLKRAAAPFNQGLEAVYPLYIDAIFNNQGGASAARVAQNYLDGTYPTNEVAACAWFSLAGMHHHPTAAAEHDRLLKNLDADAKEEAERMGKSLTAIFSQGIR